MKKNRHLSIVNMHGLIAFVVCICIISSLDGCNKFTSSYPFKDFPKDSLHKKWLDWNVSFNPTATAVQRDSTMTAIKDSIVQMVAIYNFSNSRHDSVDVNAVFCPCDSFLYNIEATLAIDATGILATTPKKPPPVGAGGPVLFISQNTELKDTSKPIFVDKPSMPFGNIIADDKKTLAVMDTGMDTAYFEKKIRSLVWTDPNGKQTLRNFQFANNSQSLDYFFDDAVIKHGTAVTSLALAALKNFDKKNNRFPRIMVLKVLDAAGVGSTFTVSCALSYAAQKQATLVNASLGSYSTGEIDPVLQKYIALCNNASPNAVPVIAAAGNLDHPHDPNLLCASPGPDNANRLSDKHLFYPGCFSQEFINVICVTGLKADSIPCHYQNASSNYVTMGVITNPGSALCCSFSVDFFNKGRFYYEGSSFATPVVSGELMSVMLTHNGISLDNAINMISAKSLARTAKRILTYSSAP